jgi:hypothetical protein
MVRHQQSPAFPILPSSCQRSIAGPGNITRLLLKHSDILERHQPQINANESGSEINGQNGETHYQKTRSHGLRIQLASAIRTLFVSSPQRGEMFIARRHAIRLALHRSATTYGALAGRKHIPLLTERTVFKGICSYKHLAPLERKQIHLLHF